GSYRVVGAQAEGALPVFVGRLRLAVLVQGVGQVVVGLGPVRLQFDGLPEAGNGLGEAVEGLEGGGAVEGEGGGVGAQGQGAVQAGQGVGGPAALAGEQPQAVPGVGVAGVPL